MGLFNFGKKKKKTKRKATAPVKYIIVPANVKEEKRLVATFKVALSHGFQSFKKGFISTHYQKYNDGYHKIKEKYPDGLCGKMVTVKVYDRIIHDEIENSYADVSVSRIIIGALWNDSPILEAIKNNTLEKLYIDYDDDKDSLRIFYRLKEGD